MIFFGWGRASKNVALSPEHAVALVYGYFHVFWLFRVSWPKEYVLATATPQGWASRPLSREEVERGGFAQHLQLHWWWRWGLLVGLGALLVILVASGIGASTV